MFSLKPRSNCNGSDVGANVPQLTSGIALNVVNLPILPANTRLAHAQLEAAKPGVDAAARELEADVGVARRPIIGVRQTRDLAFSATAPRDGALRCHRARHTRGTMGRAIPHPTDVDQTAAESGLSKLLPGNARKVRGELKLAAPPRREPHAASAAGPPTQPTVPTAENPRGIDHSHHGK